jgi:hypothetical protein
MPMGLEKGIVMTMLRSAGSLKNDKKFNAREIVIDTDTTGLDSFRLKQSMRQEHRPTSSYQQDGASASHGEIAERWKAGQ